MLVLFFDFLFFHFGAYVGLYACSESRRAETCVRNAFSVYPFLPVFLASFFASSDDMIQLISLTVCFSIDLRTQCRRTKWFLLLKRNGNSINGLEFDMFMRRKNNNQNITVTYDSFRWFWKWKVYTQIYFRWLRRMMCVFRCAWNGAHSHIIHAKRSAWSMWDKSVTMYVR